MVKYVVSTYLFNEWMNHESVFIGSGIEYGLKREREF